MRFPDAQDRVLAVDRHAAPCRGLHGRAQFRRSRIPTCRRSRSLATTDGRAGAARLPAPTDPTWWNVFRDPVLTSLEQRVADANLDVQTATLRLAESRFQRGVAAAAEFPSLNGDDKYTREQYSKNGIVSLLSGLLGPSAGGGVARRRSTIQYRLRCVVGDRSLGQGAPAGRSRPTPRSIRPRTSAATRWFRASPNWPGTICSCAACRPRSGSPTTI